MSGRPDFSTPGTRGSEQTLAVSNRPEIKEINLDSDTDVPADGSEEQEVFAPTGSIYRPLAMSIFISSPDSATTGKHVVELFSRGRRYRMAFGASTHDAGISWNYGGWEEANDIQLPGGIESQTEALRNTVASENTPLVIKYANNTDASYTGKRYIGLVVEEESY